MTCYEGCKQAVSANGEIAKIGEFGSGRKWCEQGGHILITIGVALGSVFRECSLPHFRNEEKGKEEKKQGQQSTTIRLSLSKQQVWWAATMACCCCGIK